MVKSMLDTVKEPLIRLGYDIVKELGKSPSKKSKNRDVKVFLCDYLNPEKPIEKYDRRVIKVSTPLLFEDHLGGEKEGNGENGGVKQEELYEREANILERLDHSNIPKFKGKFKLPIFDGQASIQALAMEYIPANNLEDIIGGGERFSEIEARTVLEDCLSALNYVHTGLEIPILHRDIKPSNILFKREKDALQTEEKEKFEDRGETKAYLFDFNFSSMGEKENGSTVILNYGYYPTEAATGKYTQSGDLVALGNSVIAALFGKSINDIREDQEKKGFEQVDLSKTNISPRLKAFLTKLTSENASTRYQNASQALNDLVNLDAISETELERHINEVTRGGGVKRLIDILKEKDRLFAYHVPKRVLNEFDDESLVEYLDDVYTKPHFLLDDPEEIDRYSRAGDLVIKKGDYHEGVALTKGAEGRLVSVDKQNGKAVVKFKKFGKEEISLDDLVLTSGSVKPLTQLKRFFTSDPYGPYERNTWNENRSATDVYTNELKENNYQVRYTGEDVHSGAQMLDEDVGIITTMDVRKHSGEKKYSVLGLSSKQHIDLKYYEHSNEFHVRQIGLNSNGFKLIIPNNVEYSMLRAEAFRPHWNLVDSGGSQTGQDTYENESGKRKVVGLGGDPNVEERQLIESGFGPDGGNGFGGKQYDNFLQNYIGIGYLDRKEELDPKDLSDIINIIK